MRKVWFQWIKIHWEMKIFGTVKKSSDPRRERVLENLILDHRGQEGESEGGQNRVTLFFNAPLVLHK